MFEMGNDVLKMGDLFLLTNTFRFTLAFTTILFSVSLLVPSAFCLPSVGDGVCGVDFGLICEVISYGTEFLLETVDNASIVFFPFSSIDSSTVVFITLVPSLLISCSLLITTLLNTNFSYFSFLHIRQVKIMMTNNIMQRIIPIKIIKGDEKKSTDSVESSSTGTSP